MQRLWLGLRLLGDPSLIAIYLAWTVAWLAFDPQRRLHMGVILSSAIFGAWQLAAGIARLARQEGPLAFNQARIALGIALLLTAISRGLDLFLLETVGNVLFLIAVYALVKAIAKTS